MVIRTSGGNHLTAVRSFAVAPAFFQVDTVSAVVVCFAALGNSNANFLCRAPGESKVAYTVAAVVVIAGTVRRNENARVRRRTPSIFWINQDASSAVVVSCAADRNLDALFKTLAPRIAFILTNTIATIVVAGWAIRGNNSAAARGDAPSKAGLESQTVSAVVMCITALRYPNAGLLHVAPAVSGSFAFAFATVVVAGRTVDWNSDAGVCSIAKSKASLERETVSAVIPSLATGRNLNTS